MKGHHTMSPSNYQPPIAGDQSADTKSQSVETNLSSTPSTVADLLAKKGNRTISVNPDDTIKQAVQILAENKIGAVLVQEETGKIIGILSERDVIRKMDQMPEQVLSLKVEDLMTKNVTTCVATDTLIEILQKMTDGRFRHMPAVDNNQILIGIVSIGDVVHYRLTELEYEALRMKQMIVG